MKKFFFSSLLVLLTMIGIAPTVQAQSTPQYGEELLTNIPPAATDFTGWTTSSSDSECIPTCDEGWFKTCYTEGTISQTIDLTAKGYTTPVVANTLLLYAAAEYFVGWENLASGIAKVYVDFLDAEGNILSTNYVLNREGSFGMVDITLVEDMFTIPDNTTQVRYVLQGQDQCNWIGYFGPWFRNMSCKVFDHTKVGASINVSVAETLGDSLTLSKTSDFRYGDTITVTPTYPQHPVIGLAVNEGRIINGNQVVCMGENIIISAELMSLKSVPYFEGFENGNKQDYKVAGWLLQYEEGNCNWSANNTGTSDNRSPYDGSWNATLFKGNTNWLFQALSLEKGETYALSLYARQTYLDIANATIAAVLGTAFDKEAMSDTLIAETGVNSEYQQLTDTFQVSESKVYALGIRGCINMKSWALALDNILVSQEVYPASVATPVGVDGFTEDAARAALATLSLNAQDRKGNTKCTITNLAENWVLDLENKKATYTVANSLLPMGYFFAEPTATITVDLVLNQYTFTINEAVNGSVTGTTSGTYDYGKVVTLIATPAEHYHFVQWSNGATAATYTFTLTGDTILTAIFEGDPRTITVAADENGSIKVAVDGKDTTATTFAYGTEVTLNAIPDEGYYFVEWSDGSRTTPYVFTLKQNCELTAHFAQIQYGEELLTNIPPAATNFTGWTTSGSVQCSEGWFKTSHTEGTISQTIDLAAKGYTPVAANTLFLTAAAEYHVGWAQTTSGIAKVYVEFLGESDIVLATDSVLNREGNFGTVDSTLVQGTFLIPANATKIRYVLMGKDQCYWTGYYGTWFRNMSCKINFDDTKCQESIQVSVAPELVDSITLSKTSNFHYGDTITVLPIYPEECQILWLAVNEGKIINTNQVVCFGENIVISARLKYPHAITLNGTHATLTADKASAYIGDTVTLSYALDENCIWLDYTTDINVTWIDDHRFIMPDAPVAVGNTAIAAKSLPYFEGFENGNTQDAVVADWVQQSEYGDKFWLANSTNTDFNRTPYAGSSWNATLRWSNTDWLFQALALEADENYVLSLYARQNMQDPSYAYITAALGTAFNKDAMTTTLIPATGLTDGDYQLLTDTFQVEETNAYVLGIKGYINGTPHFISMDNILVEQEVYPVSIATPVGVDGFTEDAARTALATLSLTAQDRKGNTKCTITNLAENWVLDLENKKATYTAADSLLPVGYYCTDTITVDLVLNQYTLTINEASNGTVTGTTSGTYDYGKVITLTATPAEHYHFVQWSDGTKDATYTFILKGDTTLTAEFAINQHTITIGEAENGSVKVAVNGKDTTATTFDYGTEITLTPTANVGYSFEKWDDGNTDNPREITLTKDIVITAIFKKDAPTQLLEATTETKVQKVMRNGQVFIIRNGNTYDLTGRKTE